ncbi:medium-chain fatty acid-CoA ligase faa2, partial [Spiromyces aspiralis]
QPEKTLETLDKDGWCHTGDIGLIDDLGRIKIIDRKKNLFKLAQGEYIAPERIENIYMDHPLVTQAFVYGDSLQSMLVAVISPDEGELRQFVLDRELYASPDDTPAFDTLCKEKKVREEVVKLLDEWGRSRDLKGFENIKNVLLEPHPFDPSLVSPTFKLKRPEAKAYYKARFDELYSELLNPAK